MNVKRIIAVWSGATLLAAAVCAAGPSDVADAAMQKKTDAVSALVRQKADVNAPQADGTTALHWAAHWDNADLASALLRAGANPKVANRDGATPMFLASENGSAAMLALLIKAGADPNAPVLSHGETALMLAARSGRTDAVSTLLAAGADLKAVETLRGTNALMWAAEQGQAAVVRLLIEKGADVNARSAVITPVKRGGLGFARPDKNGVQPRNKLGYLTPLLFAVRQGALDVVQMLVAAGADVQAPAIDESTPLLVAAQNGRFEIARFLLDHGADPNRTNTKGWTPLYLTVTGRDPLTTAVPPPPKDGALELIKLLLDRGADPNRRIQVKTEVHAGNTPLWLEEPGATPLLRASQFGDLTVVRLLLDHGADPLIPTLDHTTPLMVACGVGWADGFTFEYSADETVELVKLLIDKGGVINAANDHGITPLHGAAYKGANKVVQLLVDRGADLSAKDKGEDYGFGVSSVRMTPLNWAEGVPIGMSSAIYHDDTVELMTKLMQERGIPIVRNAFHGEKAPGYEFVTPPANNNSESAK